VPAEQLQHVIEKTHSGFNRCLAGSIEIDGNLDLGFAGLSKDFSSSAHNSSLLRGFTRGAEHLDPGQQRVVLMALADRYSDLVAQAR
jgi:hypothetical protein